MEPTVIFAQSPASPLPTGTTVRISSLETGGSYCVCEMTTPPGDGVTLHVHDRDEECYYILEGAYDMRAGKERFVAEVGSIVVIPPRVPHEFRNARSVVARALVTFRPGGFDLLLQEMRLAARDGPVNEIQRRAILAKWGVTFLGQDAQSSMRSPVLGTDAVVKPEPE